MQTTFQNALRYVQGLPSKASSSQPELSNDDKLQFYGLFKQATSGENKTKAPNRLKVVERMKWEAWSKLGKMEKEEAMRKYVERLTKLMPAWNGSAKL
jgi:diazepam-binding inhibitor (GABA receptor modulator, acyl-CoA-binding protein)